MSQDLTATADQLLTGALNASGARDPRDYYREQLKKLKEVDPEKYDEANKVLTSLIIFLEETLEDDDRTGVGTLAAAYANRGIIKDRRENYFAKFDDHTIDTFNQFKFKVPNEKKISHFFKKNLV